MPTRKQPDAVNGVAGFLRHNGFEVRRVPEMKFKTPDLIAQCRGDHFVIEVKTRFGHTEPGPVTESSGYRSGINTDIEKAVSQLTALRANSTAYRVLWVVIPDDDEEEFLLNGYINTLYGVQRVEMRRGDGMVEADCFFFRHCSMRKFKSLAAVIIQTAKGLVFCLNRTFQRTERFKKTGLFSLIKRRDGLIDEASLRRDKCCVISDDCKSGKGIRLLKKYGFTSLTPITRRRFTDTTGWVPVPAPRRPMRPRKERQTPVS